jgi:hypothetical protein
VPVALLQKASLIHDFPLAFWLLDRRSLRLFLLSTRESIRTRLLQPQSKPLARRICWRCSQYLEPGPGVTSGWAVRGKSLSVSRYWEKPQLSISRWCDRRRSSRGVLCSCFWKSDGAPPHSTFLPLSFLAPPRVCRAGASPAGARRRERLPYNVWVVSVRFGCSGRGSGTVGKTLKECFV